MLGQLGDDSLRKELIFFVQRIGLNSEIRVIFERTDLYLGHAFVVKPLRLGGVDPEQRKNILIICRSLLDDVIEQVPIIDSILRL